MIALEGLEISQIYVKEDARMEEMTLGQWIGTIVLCMIPCVNIVMLIVWAAGNGNPIRKRFAQAYLIVTVAVYVIGIILYAVAGAALMASLGAAAMLIAA